MTSSCKHNRCVGHFCTYATQRIVISNGYRFGTQAILHEKQGCINVTDAAQVGRQSSGFYEYERILLRGGPCCLSRSNSVVRTNTTTKARSCTVPVEVCSDNA